MRANELVDLLQQRTAVAGLANIDGRHAGFVGVVGVGAVEQKQPGQEVVVALTSSCAQREFKN